MSVRPLIHLLSAGLALLLALPAAAVEVNFQPVAEGVYAHIGDMGARTTPSRGWACATPPS